MKKTKAKSHNATKTGSAAFETVHDSVVLKNPTLFHPGNQRTLFPLRGRGGTLFTSSWLSCILDKVHSQRKVLKLSPLLMATAWNQAEVNLQSEPLAAPWICQVLGSKSPWFSVISAHCGGKGTKCSFCPKLSCQGYFCKHKASKHWDGVCSKIIQLMSFGVSSMFTALSKTLGPLSLRSLSCDINPPGPSHITP